MPYTIAEIAARTGLRAEGDLECTVAAPREPGDAGPEDLALAMDRRYADALVAAVRGRGVRAAVLWDGADRSALGLASALFAPRARVALAGVTATFAPVESGSAGVSPQAAVHPEAVLGADVSIGPFAVIGRGAVIGAGSRIHAQASVGEGARIGEDAVLHPGVRLGAGVVIGARCRIQANAVIGSDGFSYATPERGSAEQAKAEGAVSAGAADLAFVRIHSLGGVEIGDDVEIGAGTCIDAGTIAPTRVGRGTKIDNLVQIGHNCRIGESCLICGHVGLAGSVKIGDRVVLGGKAGVADNLQIGSDSVIAGGSLVGTRVPPRSVLMGAPAQPAERFKREVRALHRLPDALALLRDMRARLGL